MEQDDIRWDGAVWKAFRHHMTEFLGSGVDFRILVRRANEGEDSMTQRTRIAVLALTLAAAAWAQDQKALNYLSESRDGLLSAVKGLTPAQWNFKPAPDRWSVAEIVEHITVVEGYVNDLVAKLPQAPAPSAGFNAAEVDALILARMPDRSTKYQAPEEIQPTGRWTPQDTLQRFLAARSQNEESLRTNTELRKHVIPHPAFGPVDGYEWILLTAGHTARHTQQILEVKADPRFPR